jgi:guanylate kinase
MLAHGEFLETANVHGNLYGTSRQRVEEALARGENIVLKIDVQGAAQLRDRVPDALFIFLEPPSPEDLRERLRSRGTDDDEALRRRADDAERELNEAERYDHRVVNDDVDRAAWEILDIVVASRDENGDG